MHVKSTVVKCFIVYYFLFIPFFLFSFLLFHFFLLLIAIRFLLSILFSFLLFISFCLSQVYSSVLDVFLGRLTHVRFFFFFQVTHALLFLIYRRERNQPGDIPCDERPLACEEAEPHKAGQGRVANPFCYFREGLLGETFFSVDSRSSEKPAMFTAPGLTRGESANNLFKQHILLDLGVCVCV
jgi:hypothetical protein